METARYEIMKKAYLKAHEMVDEAEDVKIYSHIDCDGISAGSLLSSMLDKLGKGTRSGIHNS